jgi:hypothetical protein
MAVCITTLIPIFITLLLCGFLFVFFNARLADVKNAVEKQNRVLTAFITNVQSDIRGASVGNANAVPSGFCIGTDAVKCAMSGGHQLASEEAINAVRHCENEKIVVSEDEDESDTEDESDNDSESSDDSDEDADVRDEAEPVKIIKLQDSCLDSDIVEVALNIDSYIESIATEVEVEVEVDTPLTKADEDTLKVVDVTDVTSEAHATSEPHVTTEANTTSTAKTEVIDYEHTKVDDLRKIVSDKNLATKEEVKKLKKPELLALLKA